jgi:hypothetical protein
MGLYDAGRWQTVPALSPRNPLETGRLLGPPVEADRLMRRKCRCWFAPDLLALVGPLELVEHCSTTPPATPVRTTGSRARQWVSRRFVGRDRVCALRESSHDGCGRASSRLAGGDLERNVTRREGQRSASASRARPPRAAPPSFAPFDLPVAYALDSDLRPGSQCGDGIEDRAGATDCDRLGM